MHRFSIFYDIAALSVFVTFTTQKDVQDNVD